jgi:hypothetical protein
MKSIACRYSLCGVNFWVVSKKKFALTMAEKHAEIPVMYYGL